MSTNETIKLVGQLRWLAQFYDDPSIDGIALYVEQLQAERDAYRKAIEFCLTGDEHGKLRDYGGTGLDRFIAELSKALEVKE